MSLESVEEVETAPSGSLEEVSTTSECDSGAPRPRRKSLSKLRRRLSRTFRLSFSGSLSDFAQTFTIDERGEYPDSASSATTKSLDAEDILPGKLNGKKTDLFTNPDLSMNIICHDATRSKYSPVEKRINFHDTSKRASMMFSKCIKYECT